MKQYLRNRIGKLSSYLEIYLSVVIIVGIFMVSLGLINDIFTSLDNIMEGNFNFDYRSFLDLSLELIIAVEFVKMISKHTPESAIDVLLFVIARKIIVGHSSSSDVIIEILAIAVLFIIKKFLFTPNLSDPMGYLLEANTTVKEANYIAKTNISSERGKTLKEIVVHELGQIDKPITEGSSVTIDDIKFKIYSMQNNEIEKIEILTHRNDSIFNKFKKKI